MDLSSILLKLRQARDFLSQAVPNALERTAELLHVLEQAVRDSAEYLKTFQEPNYQALPDNLRQDAAALEEIRAMRLEFSIKAQTRPGVVAANRTRHESTYFPAGTEVALYNLVAFICDQIVNKVETMPPPKVSVPALTPAKAQGEAPAKAKEKVA